MEKKKVPNKGTKPQKPKKKMLDLSAMDEGKTRMDFKKDMIPMK